MSNRGQEVAVAAIGRDRPGIVAAISQLLLELEGNIADSRMAILGGHFSVMLIVELPTAVPLASLQERLEELRERLELDAATASPVQPAGSGAAATHMLTVYGADHPGIVHRITTTLAELGANITDLSTKVTSAESPVYVMMIELAIPADAAEAIGDALQTAGAEAGVEVSFGALEPEAL